MLYPMGPRASEMELVDQPMKEACRGDDSAGELEQAMDVEFERPNCVICGENEGRPAGAIAWKDITFSYLLCDGCGLKYMSPRPTQASYAQFYKLEFWDQKVADQGWRSDPDRQRWQLDPEDGFQKKLGQLNRRGERIAEIVARIAAPASGARVLDVGSGFGSVAAALRARIPCQLLAIEPSDLARAYLEDEVGCEIVGRYAEELLTPQPYDGSVDLVMFNTVLENLIDPVSILASMRRVLAPGGRVFVYTPNFYYSDAMNPYHPYVFAPASLRAIFELAGLSPVAYHGEPDPKPNAAPVCASLFESVHFALVGDVAAAGAAAHQATSPPRPSLEQIERGQAHGLQCIEEERARRRAKKLRKRKKVTDAA